MGVFSESPRELSYVLTPRMLLSVCMIVKNEAEALPRALGSLAPFGEDAELVVVDTGSDDDTVAVAEAHGAKVGHFAWNGDFAAARNASLVLASGEFVLVLDADEEVVAETVPGLRSTLARGDVDALDVVIESRMPDDKRQVHHYLRVFRRYPDAAFRYAIHEQIWPSLAPHQPRVATSDFRILHHGYALDGAALRRKQQRNLDAALKVLVEHPDDGFYLYHAGLGHLTLGETDIALKWLERALRHTEAGPPRAPVLNAIAQAHYDRDEHRAAEVKLRASVAACPEQHHGWALLGDLMLLQQRHAEAARAFRELFAHPRSAIHTDFAPHPAVARMKLGLASLLDHDPVAACDALTAALGADLPAAQRPTAERYLKLAREMKDA